LAIVRWSPSQDLASLHSAMDRLFGDMFGGMFGTPQQTNGGATGRLSEHPAYHLPVNIRETEKGYWVEAPVPGFQPEDVQVTFADGVLTINAKRSMQRQRQEGDYMRREVAFGDYWRQITLPGEIRADDIKATFENGVLNVEVPRKARPQPKRIQVTSGERQPALSGAGGQRR